MKTTKTETGFARHHSESGFVHIILILVIIVVAIGGAYYFATLKVKSDLFLIAPTPTPTVSSTSPPLTASQEPIGDLTNWKTYLDTDLGYSIGYPKTYIFTPKNGSANYIIISKPTNNVSKSENLPPFKVIIERANATSIDEAIELEMENSKQLFDINTPFTNIETTKIGVLTAKTYYHPGLGYQQHVFLQNNLSKEVVMLTISFANLATQKLEQSDVDQILSTFKFLD